MTPRMVFGLSRIIDKSDLTDFYHQVLSYTKRNAELPSLEEFLSLTLDKEAPKAFDDKTDKILEDRAYKILLEGKAQHGK